MGAVPGRSTRSLASFMQLSAMETAVLEMCANDFEAPNTIVAEVSREIGRTVSELEVKETLEVLAQGGLVQTYLLLPCRGEFVPVEPGVGQVEQAAWYKRSERGSRVHEAS